MHKLENDLLELSVIIEQRARAGIPLSPENIAHQLRVLASLSHNYLWDESVPGNPDGRDEEGVIIEMEVTR